MEEKKLPPFALDEGIVRREIQSLRQLTVRIFHWGITLLVSLQTALYFIRRETLTFLVQNKYLPDNTIILPAERYYVGTFILFIISIIFAFGAYLLFRRTTWYRNKLDEVRESNIVEPPFRKWIRIPFFSLFFLFPFLDILLRIYFMKI